MVPTKNRRFQRGGRRLAGPRCAKLDPKTLNGPGPGRAAAPTLNHLKMVSEAALDTLFGLLFTQQPRNPATEITVSRTNPHSASPAPARRSTAVRCSAAGRGGAGGRGR